MRLPCSIAAPLFLVAIGCATQRETGEALVIAGATAVAVGAQSSSHTYCGVDGVCVRQRPWKAGPALAVAGAGMALAGYALQESAHGDLPSPSPAAPPPPPQDEQRLARPPAQAPASSATEEPPCSIVHLPSSRQCQSEVAPAGEPAPSDPPAGTEW